MARPPLSSTALLLRAAWGGLLLAAGSLVALLIQFWGAKPEYADRFLILLASAWVAYSLRAKVPTTRPQTWVALPPALFAAIGFPLACFLQTQAAGGRSLLLWFDGGVLALAAVGLLLAEGGWRRARHFAFPILFVFFALPLPSRVLGPLQNRLQEATTTLAAAVLPWIGFPVERTGFILQMPSGDLGVAEACSGVQSLTALTALAAFVAYWKGFGPIRGVALTFFAVPVVVIVNALRVILSGVIQEHAGRTYIQGDWHDALGFALIFVGLAAILALSRAMDFKPFRGTVPAEKVDYSQHRSSAIVGILVLIGMLAGIGAYFSGSSREQALVQDAPLEKLPLQFGGWQGEDRPIPEEVSSMLGQDLILHRVYENNLGQRIYVWVIYWSSAKLVKGYHHPDVCWGNKGFQVTAKRIETLQPKECGPIPATAREFLRGERETQFVLYWTQEGSRIWTDTDEAAAQAETGFLTQQDWFEDALSGKPAQPSGRLVVLIGTDRAAPLAQAEMLRFSRELAEQVYTICPWGKPPR